MGSVVAPKVFQLILILICLLMSQTDSLPQWAGQVCQTIHRQEFSPQCPVRVPGQAQMGTAILGGPDLSGLTGNPTVAHHRVGTAAGELSAILGGLGRHGLSYSESDAELSAHL